MVTSNHEGAPQPKRKRARRPAHDDAVQDTAGYLSLGFTEAGVAEYVEDRRVVFVPRPEIMSLDLCWGPAGERPVLQVIFGLTLVSAGLAVGTLLVGPVFGTLARLLVASGAVTLTVVGVHLVVNALRPVYYLLVRTRTDQRKLLFHGTVDPDVLRARLSEAHDRFGYEVSWTVGSSSRP